MWAFSDGRGTPVLATSGIGLNVVQGFGFWGGALVLIFFFWFWILGWGLGMGVRGIFVVLLWSGLGVQDLVFRSSSFGGLC